MMMTITVMVSKTRRSFSHIIWIQGWVGLQQYHKMLTNSDFTDNIRQLDTPDQSKALRLEDSDSGLQNRIKIIKNGRRVFLVTTVTHDTQSLLPSICISDPELIKNRLYVLYTYAQMFVL